MKIINVQPKDIHVTIEFSLESLKHIETVLGVSNIEFNSKKEPEMAEAVKYVVDDFYPSLSDFLSNLEKE